MAHTSLSLIALWLLLTAPVASAQMPRIELSAGFYRIDAEVAQDAPRRSDPAVPPAASTQPPPPAADNPILEVLRRELGAEPLG